MLLTEEQYKEKWCPKGRKAWMEEFTLGAAGATFNDPNEPSTRATCIASDCAMWRWGDHDRKRHNKGCGGHTDPFFSGKCDCPRLGYCGLAGKP